MVAPGRSRGRLPGDDRALQCTPIEEKESSKWLQALRETVERARGVQLITVSGSGIDFFEFLTQATEQRAVFSSVHAPIGCSFGRVRL